MTFYTIVNCFRKILHLLILGALGLILIITLFKNMDKKEHNKIRKLLKDIKSDVTVEIIALVQLKTLLKEMEGDIYDGLMGSYQEELLEIVEMQLENMEKTQQRLNRYL